MEPCGPHVTLFTLAFGLYKIAASSLFISLASNLVTPLNPFCKLPVPHPTLSLPLGQKAAIYCDPG